jgi:hypothetical protein
MAQIPTHDQWMKETSSLTSPRSDFLKLVDDAIKGYNLAKTPDNKTKLKTTFDRWRFEQSKQGKDWRKSVRNQKGAATNLYRALNEDKRNLTPEEQEALKFIAEQQKLALVKQFAFVDVKFKSSTLMGAAQGAGTAWQKFKTGASSVKQGASTAKSAYTAGKNIAQGVNQLKQGISPAAAASAGATAQMGEIQRKVADLCRTLCPDVDPNHVFAALHLGDVTTFAAEVAPFVGAISSGGKAIIGWIGVAKKAYDSYDMADRRHAFKPGDPEAAFDAVSTLLDREIASATAQASVRTVAFTGKALGAFADYGAVTGPVIGLLELLATIMQAVVEYVRDFLECRDASKLLRTGPLDLSLFAVCPILGCYFLVIQDHSTIINFAVGDYGTPNFVFDVEKLVKKIDPVLVKSRNYIKLSRLEIPGMENSKGIVEANYSVKTGLGKVTGLPEHVKDKVFDTIEGWFEKPQKVAVDKSRIVGMGSKP